MKFSPQEGPQTAFLSTPADIAIFGGAAGGGKSYALLLETLRHYRNPKFGAICFRRNSTQVRNTGGLWDTSLDIYAPLNASPKETTMEWTFPAGGTVKFAHLEHETTVLNYQGAQIPLILWDELTHFEESQFWYMLSRLRSTSGIPGYMRATTNPDADSWVRRLIDWWLDEDGYPIPERSGKLRYFIKINDSMQWADDPSEIFRTFGNGPEIMPKSLTFIASSLFDNKILMAKDPSYHSNLLALDRVERMRLLGGNWNVRPSAGMIFRREWFPIVEAIPSGWVQAIRFWDRAATKPHAENPDPDWTRGLLLYKYRNGTYVVGDLRSMRDTPRNVEQLVLGTAHYDGHGVQIMSQQDPGSAGVAEAENFIRMLAGFYVRVMVTSKDKVTRAKPVSAQAEANNISVIKAPWNHEFFTELENFPDGKHDDCVDVLSGAFNEINQGLSLLDVL